MASVRLKNGVYPSFLPSSVESAVLHFAVLYNCTFQISPAGLWCVKGLVYAAFADCWRWQHGKICFAAEQSLFPFCLSLCFWC